LVRERFPSDDTILNYFRRFSQTEIERFWRPCGAGSSAGFQSWKGVLVWTWIRRFFLGMALSNKEPPEATILGDRGRLSHHPQLAVLAEVNFVLHS